MKRILPLLLVLALALTGCSSMLEREYSSSTRHVEYPVSDDTSILQAESYQGLVSAVLYFVTEHAQTGVVHLSNYVGDVENDLDVACAEVLEQDPLGAYALNSIEHRYTRIVSYYEVSFTFDYARTEKELANMISAGSSGAVPGVLGEAMAEFKESCVLRLSYFSGDEAALLTLARQAWLDTPLAALTRPDIRVTLYPDSGTSRIAEFTFQWEEDIEELAARSGELENAARSVIQSLGVPPDGLTVESLLEALKKQTRIEADGGTTAYAALVEGSSEEQGFVLALQLLCQQAGLETTVVEGRMAEEARFWLVVSTPEGYRHFDPNAEPPVFCTDEVFAELGYAWSGERYPACIDYATVDGLTSLENGGENSAEN